MATTPMAMSRPLPIPMDWRSPGLLLLDRLETVTYWLGHTTVDLRRRRKPDLTRLPQWCDRGHDLRRGQQVEDDHGQHGKQHLLDLQLQPHPLGQITSSAYSVEGLTHTYSYSTLNQLVGDQPGSGTAATWTVDSANSIIQLTNPAQTTSSTLGYDQAQELTGVHTTSGATVTQNLSLSYNADGARTAQTDSVATCSSQSYSYDQAMVVTRGGGCSRQQAGLRVEIVEPAQRRAGALQ